MSSTLNGEGPVAATTCFRQSNVKSGDILPVFRHIYPFWKR
ncbi:hypothetical protein CLOSYM_05042 [[Clostridium] symbiosum ATCC 14940]|uniref:Uncharacterized protein n=1 Tax=[Clostridium] symbiosum ATCC 14940 TaxID=411472 RepID=A0ABC9TPP6_CLOSY|nr:hypothetical protein CLOSYM_05042 [[Clostridium] symbiosum ATCC 14940]